MLQLPCSEADCHGRKQRVDFTRSRSPAESALVKSFEITEPTRKSVFAWIRHAALKADTLDELVGT